MILDIKNPIYMIWGFEKVCFGINLNSACAGYLPARIQVFPGGINRRDRKRTYIEQKGETRKRM